MSPPPDRRRDAFGGDLTRRLAFPFRLIRQVRAAPGPDFPLFYRGGADDRLPEGNDLRTAPRILPVLMAAGADCLDLSGGLAGCPKNGLPGAALGDGLIRRPGSPPKLWPPDRPASSAVLFARIRIGREKPGSL
jgi:hypothetical protein